MKVTKTDIIVLISIIVFFIVALIVIKVRQTSSVDTGFSEDPKDWVEINEGKKLISLQKATEGISYEDYFGQQYETTVFSYEGWYTGNYFKREYTDLKGNTIMRITNEMVPSDGIIEGYLIEKIEDKKPRIYIFLDSDWKNALPSTKIHWGKFYQNEKEFTFDNEISKGIYLNIIDDDENRFQNKLALHYGGVYVGILKDDKTSTVIHFS